MCLTTFALKAKMLYQNYSPNKTVMKLKALSDRMTNVEPSLRPTAGEVAREFDRLSQEIGYFSLREWIWPARFPYTVWKKLRVVLGHSEYPP